MSYFGITSSRPCHGHIRWMSKWGNGLSLQVMLGCGWEKKEPPLLWVMPVSRTLSGCLLWSLPRSLVTSSLAAWPTSNCAMSQKHSMIRCYNCTWLPGSFPLLPTYPFISSATATANSFNLPKASAWPGEESRLEKYMKPSSSWTWFLWSPQFRRATAFSGQGKC